MNNIDLALMQSEKDAERIVSLGRDRSLTTTTGNLKFDLELNGDDEAITRDLDNRFKISGHRPLIIAASTHDHEERWMLEAFCSLAAGGSTKPRLLIAPRHPERFDAVAKLVRDFRNDPACEWTSYKFVRRSESASDDDTNADIILLDSIGELRAAYPLAEIVVVGGSMIPHGGQSVLEPASAGKAIVTGHHTHNFEDVLRTFRGNNAVIQLPAQTGDQLVDELFLSLSDLMESDEQRKALGRNAAAVMKANRGATAKTIESLKILIAEN